MDRHRMGRRRSVRAPAHGNAVRAWIKTLSAKSVGVGRQRSKPVVMARMRCMLSRLWSRHKPEWIGVARIQGRALP
jgi:hypothetical protein